MPFEESASTKLVPELLEPCPSVSEVERLLTKYKLPEHQNFSYGTAGFRYDASLLPAVMVRVGLFGCLRSLQLQQAIGCMVTASHNDESYNGVKLADPDGGMMSAEAEALAVELANERDIPSLLRKIQQLQAQYQLSSGTYVPVVHLGRDTREHSPSLACLTMHAARALGARVIDHGVVTTPMLHYCVMHANPQYLPLLIPSRPNVAGYYDTLVHSYLALISTLPISVNSPLPPLLVDCACGVGFGPLQVISQEIQSLSRKGRNFSATNGPDAGPLNTNCGSEHVQKSLQAPTWYEEDAATTSHDYCASLDGDADRIVFFRESNNDGLLLLDGDKIACLLCLFLQQQLATIVDAVPELPSIALGVVQTAYANGASTTYLQSVLGDANVKIAKTGVKFVHAAAHEFDIGVYFEANGHGTILFGRKFYDWMAVADSKLRGVQSAANTALQSLKVLPSLVNQAVGDALSDLLLVDAILQLQNWTLDEWNALYTDQPSRQAKVRVRDRSMVQVNDNETMCLQPAAIQSELNEAMQELQGRAFCRPSGTEDVVRVYAEAPSRLAANQLAQRAVEIVHRLAGGVGDPPVFPASRM